MPVQNPLESLFARAVEIENEAERAAFLAASCGDDVGLRKELGELIAAHREAGAFLASPAADLAATALQPSIGEKCGDAIGPYKLLEQIGEGGMGLVFMAEQSIPLRRRVALKIIKPGLDTRAVITRFEAERQALALMDHPNIARVYDAGATESGRPFFVMELVRGSPITEYCQQRTVRLRERLELFIEVCQAVQHAHQKGIIHRDLKPTNILVTQADTAPVPKVIDFGVAKATTHPLTERTLFTSFSQIIGTPLYMSPEQADLNNQDVDTRSDVYSLGVVLYELLTGTTPFDAERLRSVGYDEMRRIIRDEEPPKPSTRATTVAAATTAIAPATGRRKLSAIAIKGDLDWIVMKALEKDRQRRYESPSALANDIARHLNNEPVDAGPPTRRYRLLKFVRRNRALLLTTGVIATMFIVGLGASVWQALRATKAEQAKGVALQQARRAVDDMYTKVAEEWLSSQGRLTDVQRELLESAEAFYNSLASQPGANSDVLYENLRALDRVGSIRRRLGDGNGALEIYRQLGDECSALTQRFPAHPEFQSEFIWALAQVAILLRNQDRHNEAAAELDRALQELKTIDHASIRLPVHRQRFAAALGLLSSELTVTGRTEQAQTAISMALDVRQQLVAEQPNNFDYRRGLAVTLTTLGKRQMWWGSTDGKAEETLRRADGLLTELLMERPKDVATRRALDECLGNLGVVLGRENRNGEAVDIDRRALSNIEQLASEFSEDPKIQENLSIALQGLAADLVSSGRWQKEEVRALNLRAHDVLENMVVQFPDEADPKSSYLASLVAISHLLYGEGEHESSQKLLERSSPRLREFALAHGLNPAITSRVAVCLSKLAAGYLERDDHRRAVDAIKAYPPDWSRFTSEPWLPFRRPPEQLAEMRRHSYFAKVYLLLTPMFLLEQCASLAESDQALDPSQRTAAVHEYTELSHSFREQAELALDAWLQEVYVHDHDIAFRAAIEAWRQIVERQSSQTNTAIPPSLRAAYKASNDYMFQKLVDEATEHLAGNVEQIHIANVLSTAPQELQNPDLALKLAQQALEVASEDPAALQAYGWALFRAQRWQECVDILLASKETEADQPRPILAMALWQLGRHDDARTQFEGAKDRLKAYESTCNAKQAKGMATLPNPDMMRRLYKEATSLIDAN